MYGLEIIDLAGGHHTLYFRTEDERVVFVNSVLRQGISAMRFEGDDD